MLQNHPERRKRGKSLKTHAAADGVRRSLIQEEISKRKARRRGLEKSAAIEEKTADA